MLSLQNQGQMWKVRGEASVLPAHPTGPAVMSPSPTRSLYSVVSVGVRNPGEILDVVAFHPRYTHSLTEIHDEKSLRLKSTCIFWGIWKEVGGLFSIISQIIMQKYPPSP